MLKMTKPDLYPSSTIGVSRPLPDTGARPKWRGFCTTHVLWRNCARSLVCATACGNYRWVRVGGIMRNLNTGNWVENGVYSNRLMDDRYPEHQLIVGGASHSVYQNAYRRTKQILYWFLDQNLDSHEMWTELPKSPADFLHNMSWILKVSVGPYYPIALPGDRGVPVRQLPTQGLEMRRMNRSGCLPLRSVWLGGVGCYFCFVFKRAIKKRVFVSSISSTLATILGTVNIYIDSLYIHAYIQCV